ncbi:ATP-dependent DNA helicase DinG [Falsibacillus albus]|uniref:3'-5' exonuclease DinG n=1 Tax=Falsibacillus albus TaxID=2478915 RepID=A0A3L7JW92_9BACI|nr:ATP-dependent DNA helicase DinG [Falsibacillus albus]RLQ95127.1 ATP-dependent helicase DinG [Falsibacillus albus]
MTQKYVVVDLETTGNAPKKGDRIIQISAVVVENRKIKEQFTSFVNPEQMIPAFITELTGIDDEMVKDAPTFDEIAPDIIRILDGSIFTAHNVNFDLNFLQAELEEAGYPCFNGPSVDTVEMAKILLPTADSYKLTELSSGFSLNHERPHQADSDAYATALLLLEFMEKIEVLPMVTIENLLTLSFHLKSDVHLVLQALHNIKLSHIENLPDHLEVYRGIVLAKNQEIQHVELKPPSFPESNDEKNQLLSFGVDGFEAREGQLQMMDMVMKAFRKPGHAVIEAGTGIGKSLGYLIPSIYYSVEKNAPVIISTYTNQLQEQLLSREISALQKMLPFSFKTALLKGRSHYLHLLKFEQTLKEEDAQYDSVLTKMQILVWLTSTMTGDLGELNLSSGGRLYCSRIKHDGWYLSKEKDPWVSKDFYLKARKNAENANIIITNHAMLMNDLLNETSILPPYETLVLDEAHHIEKAARAHAGASLDIISSKFLLGQLGTNEKRQLAHRLYSLIEEHGITISFHPFEMDRSLQDLDQDFDDLFGILAHISRQFEKKHQPQFQKIQYLLNEIGKDGRDYKSFYICAERVKSGLKDIRQKVETGLETVKKAERALSAADKALLEELHGLLIQWEEMERTISDLILRPDERNVIWVEADLNGIPNSLSIIGQPVSLDKQLRDFLFSVKKSVVMTSATLTVKSSFDYFLQEVGLSGREILKLQLPSPFEYQKMAKLIIPNDIPEIRKVQSAQYIDAISNHIIALAEATKGRMLILFTSFDMLKRTYNLIKDSGTLDDYVLMAQGISGGSRTRLTKNFQRFDKAILFGTNSFWEGVDIPGEDLSCLIIVRLPFAPPNEPVTKAKCRQVEKAGNNSFSEYSLPEAVLRFKQGFGRLIRRSTDRGIVIVFDRRIMTTSYGRAFTSSIPPIPTVQGDINEIVTLIEDWL